MSSAPATDALLLLASAGENASPSRTNSIRCHGKSKTKKTSIKEREKNELAACYEKAFLVDEGTMLSQHLSQVISGESSRKLVSYSVLHTMVQYKIMCFVFCY